MSLASSLKEIFEDCFDYSANSSGDPQSILESIIDRYTSGLAEAFKDSLESGILSTVYTGTCSLGTSPGTVFTSSYSIQADSSAAESDLASLVESECSIEEFSEGLASIVDSMVKGATYKENITGTVIPSVVPPPTVPASGSSEASVTTVPTVLESELLRIHQLMDSSVEGWSEVTNEDYANMLADAILAFFASSVLTFQASGSLSGLSGISSMTGNV